MCVCVVYTEKCYEVSSGGGRGESLNNFAIEKRKSVISLMEYLAIIK